MARTRGIIAGSIVITAIIGVLNEIYKKDKLPGLRFFFGTGVLYLMLSGLAEFEEEIAKNIAIAVVVFSVIGEGGGVIDHFLGKGSASTTLDTTPPNDFGPVDLPITDNPGVIGAAATRRDTSTNAVSAPLGKFPPKPVLGAH